MTSLIITSLVIISFIILVFYKVFSWTNRLNKNKLSFINDSKLKVIDSIYEVKEPRKYKTCHPFRRRYLNKKLR